MNEFCLSSFSKSQLLEWPTIQQIAQNKTIDSWVYLHDNNQPVPENVKNTFPWRGVYRPIQEFDFSSLRLLNYFNKDYD
ncbi:unnamed protein product, partial [Rotaria sp. Silwood2]